MTPLVSPLTPPLVAALLRGLFSSIFRRSVDPTYHAGRSFVIGDGALTARAIGLALYRFPQIECRRLSRAKVNMAVNAFTLTARALQRQKSEHRTKWQVRVTTGGGAQHMHSVCTAQHMLSICPAHMHSTYAQYTCTAHAQHIVLRHTVMAFEHQHFV